MAIEEDKLAGNGDVSVSKHKRTTFGTGLLKGLGITFRHLVSPAITMQYPDEKDDYPARSRGVIALKTENCTVCMLCARECPDWCIYIEGHKQAREPVSEGKRAKKFNVLDRFAIDYALCMYCGICVEVCPYDALFWSPEYEYADTDIVELTHEKEKLNEWMYTVLPPMALDDGAQGPELKAAPAPPPAAAAPPAEAARTQGGPVPAAADTSSDQAPVVTPAIAPAESGTQAAPPEDLAPPKPQLDPELVYKAILKGELAHGTDQKVAEARARTAAERIKDEAFYIGRKKGATPAQTAAPATEEPVQSKQTPAAAAEPAPAAAAEPAAAEAEPAATAAGVSDEEAAKVREQVMQEQLAKGSDPRVAQARAKAAEMRARKGTKGPA